MHKTILSVFALMIIVLSTLAGCTTVIRTPPPPARIDIRPGPPYGGAVWIEGHWARRHGNWMWAPGHWKKRPGPGAGWVPGHWREGPRGWKWKPGRWRY